MKVIYLHSSSGLHHNTVYSYAWHNVASLVAYGMHIFVGHASRIILK